MALHLKQSRVRLWLSVPHAGQARPTKNSSQYTHLFLAGGLTRWHLGQSRDDPTPVCGREREREEGRRKRQERK